MPQHQFYSKATDAAIQGLTRTDDGDGSPSRPHDFSSDSRWHHIFYGAPSPKELKAFGQWLRSRPNDFVRLYHGSAAVNDIAGKGILPTSSTRRNSYQSTSGYSYLSAFPGAAQAFGSYAAANRSRTADGARVAVFPVVKTIRSLLADKDQLANQRLGGRDVGDSLAESLAYGHGARVRGGIGLESVGAPLLFSVPGPGVSVTTADPVGFEDARREVGRVEEQVAALLGTAVDDGIFGRPGGIRVMHSDDLPSISEGGTASHFGSRFDLVEYAGGWVIKNVKTRGYFRDGAQNKWVSADAIYRARIYSDKGAAGASAAQLSIRRSDLAPHTANTPAFEPVMGVGALLGLQGASPDLEQLLADHLAATGRALDAIGVVHDCAILRHENQARWQMVLRDASTAGNWRTQGFDVNGFFGHMTFATKQEAIESAVTSDYTVRDDEALDRLQDTAAFQRGLFCSEVMRLANAGEIAFEEAIKRVNKYDETRAVLAQVGNAAAQAFYSGETGEIVLIADRIAPGKEQAVFLHEIVHKHGMTRLGPRVMERLVGQVAAWSSEAPETSERKIHDAAARRAGRAAAPGTALFSEEFFAYAVEEAVGLGVRPSIDARTGSAESWLADVVATIQGVVFDMTHGAAPEFDAQRLVDLAYALAQLEHPQRGQEIRAALGEASFRAVRAQLDAAVPFNPVETEGFKQWSRGLPVVELADSDRDAFKSGVGVVVEALHGTTADFDRFSLRRANIEANVGIGIYATNSAADVSINYAGFGPDLTQKLGRIAERLEQEREWGEADSDVASDEDMHTLAKRELGVCHDGMVLPIYMRLENPAVLGGHGETKLSGDLDEDAEKIGGPLAEFLEYLQDSTRGVDPLLSQHEADDLVDCITKAWWEADGEPLAASELLDVISKADCATCDGFSNSELFRGGLARLGYDGIIDTTVNAKFGASHRSAGMQGVKPDTVHFVAFDPSQVASRIGSTWCRDAHACDILKSVADGECQNAGDTLSGQGEFQAHRHSRQCA